RNTIGVLTFASALGAAPAFAQQPAPAPAAMSTPVQAMARDMVNLSDKFSGLARVMAGKYDWRPGQGVRSVGEVFNLIVTENKMLAGLLAGAGGPAPGMAAAAPITDAAALQEALKSSYAAVGQALSTMSPAALATPVTLFGRNTTKEGAVFILMLDQHEHLGQSIAYARSNSIVPPWSK
ncbi:MAG: DinB family protein, partial [Acidobacteriota bacterium]